MATKRKDLNSPKLYTPQLTYLRMFKSNLTSEVIKLEKALGKINKVVKYLLGEVLYHRKEASHQLGLKPFHLDAVLYQVDVYQTNLF